MRDTYIFFTVMLALICSLTVMLAYQVGGSNAAWCTLLGEVVGGAWVRVFIGAMTGR